MILATLALFPLIQVQLGLPRSPADQVNETQLEFPATSPEAKGGKKATSRPYISFAQGSDPFQIIQVNVDTDGNNIVGDAANEPSMPSRTQIRTEW
ncbi:MAG: hypothetical protein KatS3mg015_0250 [Fimbriimonadales bacterium]|nr:MAG: hypothetical protein KatS3mg015_0250 [Fimbriimonadales bacterium]